jgi:hypothetical protein
MKSPTRIALMGCALAVLAGAAIAAPGGGGPAATQAPNSNAVATFYSQPNFRGAPITITQATPDLGSVNFNDIARSARVVGDWQVCENTQFRGHCETISGAVADLDDIDLSGAISSARPGTFANPDTGRGGRGGGDGDRGAYDRGDNDRGGNDRGDDDRGGYDRGGNDRGGYGGGQGGWNGRPDRQDRSEGRSAVFFPNPTINGQPIAAFGGRLAADMFCRRQGYGPAIYFDTTGRGRGLGQDNRFITMGPVLSDVLCRRARG